MNEKTNTPEPLAAILAEMRDGIHTGRADIIDCVNDVLARYADRIEAAVKREKCRDTIYAGRDGEMTLDECIVRCDNNSGDDPRGRDIAQIGAWLRELRDLRRAPGNAAAMRSALESIADDCRVLDRKDMWEEEGECYYDALRDIREKVSAALAAPARNCDRFATPDEAMRAFAVATGTTTIDLDAAFSFAAWLFALERIAHA